MNYDELYKAAREPGRYVYVWVAMTDDDGIYVEVKKMAFVGQVAEAIGAGMGEVQTNAVIRDNDVWVN